MKITIEEGDFRMVVEGGDLELHTSGTVSEITCDCPGGCGAVHRTVSGPWHLALVGRLDEQPRWERA